MLKLTNIKKSYRQPNGDTTPILDVPSYAVDQGEQAVMIGPSGCGKTTLLHIISGITSPDQGSVEIEGTTITDYSETGRDKIRADKIGYVFQTFNLLQGFSALENVLLGMTFARKKIERNRARDLLDRVGLSHRLKNRPHELSVGEQQRVAVARALANKPRLLLADEPTANIDPNNQQQTIELISKTCQDEGIALIIVTHSMDVAKQFDRVDRLDEINLVVSQARAGRSGGEDLLIQSKGGGHGTS